ncbi:MAG: hypothetical protein IIA87_01930 [Nanoarchaeota archaeon]|nr:hypothetical protein [Nanoarchaeota archaeon]
MSEITTDSAATIGTSLFIHKYDPRGGYGSCGVSPGLSLKFYGGPGKYVGTGGYGFKLGKVIKGIRVYDAISDDGELIAGPDSTVFLDEHNGGLLLPFHYNDMIYHYRVAIPYEELPTIFNRQKEPKPK